MFSLCCSQKPQDSFVLSELRYRVSDKLGPAAHKQKINTFKLLKVMHKYLSAIHAGSSRERLRVRVQKNQKLSGKFQNFKIAQTLAFSGPY